MVAALRHATGVDPVATGKPDPTMHRESVQRSGAERPIVVGDRLDTDIEGANAVGCPSLLVLSGVTTPRDLLTAPSKLRPSYLGCDVSALLTTHAQPVTDAAVTTCGPWRVTRQDDGLLLSSVDGAPSGSADGLDPLRALCTAAWSAAGSSDGQCRAEGAEAKQALADHDLAG
jgi:glycerol-1-phosphatase